MTWIISFVSIFTIFLYGYKTPWGPAIGFFSQGLWYWLIWKKKLWGLFICTFGFGVVHLINWIKWSQ